MKKNLVLGGLAILAAAVFATAPAKADPPHHDEDHGRYSDRGYSDRGYSDRGYSDRGYSDYDHDRRDHSYSSDYRYGRGYSSGYGGYRGDPYRHNDHPAERKKFNHRGRHVIDRRHGHHR